MTTRNHGKVNPILIAFLIPLVVVMVTVVFMFVRYYRHSSIETFNTKAYLSAPKEFVGNRYKLDAQIESQLRVDDGFGRILAVKPLDGSGALSVFLPEDLGVEVRVGQRFHLTVAVRDMGLLEVEDLNKY